MTTPKFQFCIDRGGTFTDVHCILPNGKHVVSKLLSEDPLHYPDAPTEGIRRLLEEHGTSGQNYPRGSIICCDEIASIRMGTTVATNALLERQGSPLALVITKGFQDLLQIGNQSRPDIFDLTCAKPSLLYTKVVEVDERVALNTFYNHDDNGDTDETETETTPTTATSQQQQHTVVQGLTGEQIRILQTPNLDQIRKDLQKLKDEDGIEALAICLMHSFTFPDHELLIGKIAEEIGFQQISLSSQVMPMVKLVSRYAYVLPLYYLLYYCANPICCCDGRNSHSYCHHHYYHYINQFNRAHTACAAAYLTPKITDYLNGFLAGFDKSLTNGNVPLTFIQSDGGLAPYNDFGGHHAILSGPAGGVVGYAKTTPSLPVIGFDMGGTSTDVSRYNGVYEHVLETTTAGVAIQAPQLDIHTVAAGGGSRLFWQHGMLVVGPESAGAHPGPVCYRKGGHLAVTDANAVLGRILPQEFPAIFGPNEDQPLHVEGSQQALEALRQEHCPTSSLEEFAYGYLQVANEAMCRPIRNLTQMKGFDITTHTLACFGGAGPQHACAMAKALGMSRVFVHRYGGVLSAYGLSMADAVQELQEPTAHVYQQDNQDFIQDMQQHLARLAEKATTKLMAQGYKKDQVVVEKYVNMRYEGTDNAIMICESPDSSYSESFVEQYQREFGFVLEGRELVIDDYRVRVRVPGSTPPPQPHVDPKGAPPASYQHRAYFESGWHQVPVYKMDDLEAGHQVEGPCIVVQAISTVVLEENCKAIVTSDGDLDIAVETTPLCRHDDDAEIVEDPVQLSIFSHRFMGIAEQMGRTLARTAISVNMKERLDFSCALFTADGGLVANAPHIPVHLGAMQSAVTFQVEHWKDKGGIQEGDVLVSNHPQLAGGSHLPDITVITPVFHKGVIIFFVASRGHHADIGGIAPGSMPPHSKKLEDEGAMIVAFKLVKDGEFQQQGITEILQAPGKLPGNSGTRNLRDNLSDLRAQVAANHSGIRLLHQLVEEYGLKTVDAYMKFIQNNAEVAVRAMLKTFAKKNGNTAHAVDYMDDGSPIVLTITIDPETGAAVFDFTGTGPQVLANHNAPPAVTYSAVIYSLRSLVNQDIPLNQGCLAPIKFVIPKYTLLNPSEDAGVVGGNVLTSQRVVDVVLLAFSACAASQGCMNNLTFGDNDFGYYETIAGGAGAGPTWAGMSGVHTHCTNTRITDPEILERRYPVLLREFGIRPNSGGAGKHRGGDGVIRELEPLRPLTMSILSERRTLRPYGMAGGEDGSTGRNLLIKANGIVVNMGGRCSGELQAGERLRIETPGGGGYGKKEE